MRTLLLALTAAITLALAAHAEPYKNTDLHLSLTVPEKFTYTDTGTVPDVIGKQKARFVAPDVEKPAGSIVIHQMPLPDAMDYAQFRAGAEDGLKAFFGDSSKVLRVENVEQGGWTGFMIEAELPGNEKGPEPGGSVRHHVRWYLLRDGTDKLVGIAFDAREEAWKGFEEAYGTSFKSLKKTE